MRLKTNSNIQGWFDSRGEARRGFLSRCGLKDAVLSPVGEDCGSRRYFRLNGGDRSLIFMEAIPDDDRRAKPGHKIGDFVRIGRFLNDKGLRSPEIYEYDAQDGYVLLEDFGDTNFKEKVTQASDPAPYYERAVDILKYMRDHIRPDEIALPRYYDSHIHEARRLMLDWYLPRAAGIKPTEELVQDYLAVWDEIEAAVPPCPEGFLHIDYHAENLMWLPEENGLKRLGILDFQGAMHGPQPYDLANILEDVRMDIDSDMREAMITRYCEGMGRENEDVFRVWYRILATQFHCRVIGLFIRIAEQDGKRKYLQHIPRIEAYLNEGLKDPVLAPLKEWLEK